MTAASPDFPAWLRDKSLTSDVYIGMNTLKRDAQSRTKEDVDASLVLHYAVLVAHFLAPEAIPGALVVPLRGGFEIAGAGREVLANYVFV